MVRDEVGWTGSCRPRRRRAPAVDGAVLGVEDEQRRPGEAALVLDHEGCGNGLNTCPVGAMPRTLTTRPSWRPRRVRCRRTGWPCRCRCRPPTMAASGPEAARPHALTRLVSVKSAGCAPSETRLCTTYALATAAEAGSEASGTANSAASAAVSTRRVPMCAFMVFPLARPAWADGVLRRGSGEGFVRSDPRCSRAGVPPALHGNITPSVGTRGTRGSRATSTRRRM